MAGVFRVLLFVLAAAWLSPVPPVLAQASSERQAHALEGVNYFGGLEVFAELCALGKVPPKAAVMAAFKTNGHSVEQLHVIS